MEKESTFEETHTLFGLFSFEAESNLSVGSDEDEFNEFDMFFSADF